MLMSNLFIMSITPSTPTNRITVLNRDKQLVNMEGDYHTEKVIRAIISMANVQELDEQDLRSMVLSVDFRQSPIKREPNNG